MMPRTDLVMAAPLSSRTRRRRDPGPMNHDAAPNMMSWDTWVPALPGSRPGSAGMTVSVNNSRVAGHVGPHLLLGEVHQPGEDHEEDHHLEADALARLEVRLGRPHHEGRDVL